MWSAIAGAVGAVAKLLATALPWWFGKSAGKAEARADHAERVLERVGEVRKIEDKLRADPRELERLRRKYRIR